MLLELRYKFCSQAVYSYEELIVHIIGSTKTMPKTYSRRKKENMDLSVKVLNWLRSGSRSKGTVSNPVLCLCGLCSLG